MTVQLIQAWTSMEQTFNQNYVVYSHYKQQGVTPYESLKKSAQDADLVVIIGV